MENVSMSEWPEHVRLRVVTNKVKLSNISVPVPKGEYDGYADWQNGPSMQCEVLRYLKQGDIERV
jgi:hypothetical protein